MSDVGAHLKMIDALSADLRPVARVWPPWLQTLFWLLVVGLLAAALASIANLPAVMARLGAVPDMGLAALGSTLTAITAIFAACLSGIPGRSGRWSLLPLPPLCLWIGASGLGCLRDWILPGMRTIPMAETRVCLMLILALSVPLGLLTMLMLRRSWPVRPGLTAGLAGLGVAAAAASLLNLFHPYDASATDLLVHAVAVLIVIASYRVVAPRFIAPRF